jgi:hypothetical protein
VMHKESIFVEAEMNGGCGLSRWGAVIPVLTAAFLVPVPLDAQCAYCRHNPTYTKYWCDASAGTVRCDAAPLNMYCSSCDGEEGGDDAVLADGSAIVQAESSYSSVIASGVDWAAEAAASAELGMGTRVIRGRCSGIVVRRWYDSEAETRIRSVSRRLVI